MKRIRHTPGPWTVGDNRGHEVAIDALGGDKDFHSYSWTELATVYGSDDDGLSGKKKAKANARRIVACVNALEGIPTSQIEKAGTGLMSDCAVYAAELYNQRDILLEALERIVDLDSGGPAGLGDAVRIASEAIEQVKEKIDE